MVRRLTIFGPRAPGGWRRAALAALVLAVVAVHGCVTNQVVDQMDDIGAARAMPPRIEVAYVRELAVTEPPTVAAAPPRAVAPARVARAPKPARAASAPIPSRPASAPEPMPDPALLAEPVVAAASAPAPEPAASSPVVTAADTAASAAASVAAAASAPAGPPFEWPASTRVSYVLTGNYRGEVQGDAQVEWVKVGARYQVHLDITVGPSFAPVVSRRMSSDGEIGPGGLVPGRYDQDTKVAFRANRRVTMSFDPDTVVMANGDRVATVAGVQDTASQFVQLTYLFTTQPGLLKAGNTVEVPLALPHKLDRWIYDVVNEEPLYTPFGPLDTWHLKPRRAERKAGELSAEIWFAPGLRYLPVRIRIQQDPETFIDLMIARRPQMAAAPESDPTPKEPRP